MDLPNAFQVYDCCDSANIIIVNIDGTPTNTDAVYSYISASPFTIGGFTFVPNNCYRIKYVGNEVVDAGPLFTDFQYQGKSCLETENCPGCATTELYLRFVSCCNNSTLYFRTPPTTEYINGVYEYIGTPTLGLENICYSITLHEVGEDPILDLAQYAALPVAPNFVENLTFDTFSNISTACQDFELDCPACNVPCYTLYNCDGIYFNTTADMSAYVGTFVSIYNQDGPIVGTWYVLVNNGNCKNAISDIAVDDVTPPPCTCRCFEVTGNAKNIIYINCDGELVKTFGSAKFCAYTYPFVTGTPGEYQVSEGGECVDGVCPQICYSLTNCDTGEVINSTVQSLSQYVITGNVVQIAGYIGCWQVSENTQNCNCLTVTITQESGSVAYTANVIGTHNGLNVYSFDLDGTTIYIWFSAEKGWVMTLNGYGTIEWPEAAFSTYDGVCPDSINELFVWTSVLILGDITTEKCPATCDCPVNVIVLQDFETCQDCLPIIAYKLTNCEDAADIKYTYDDLSVYIDQVVKSDCGCYLVELINYQPPSVASISIVTSFTSCIDCLKQYYLLTDCNYTETPIYTYADLSSYLGQVIKIDGCDTCWTIQETEIPINPQLVVVSNTYIDCETCIPPLPCTCNRMTNFDTIQHRYNYIDCNDNIQGFILQPGESSGKICLKVWTVSWPDTDNLEVFGDCSSTSNLCNRYEIAVPSYFEDLTLYYKDCSGNVISEYIPVDKFPRLIVMCGIPNQTSNDIYTVPNIGSELQFTETTVCNYPTYACPITIPKRKIKPGYSVPTCDIEKWEKITCKSSEILYKQVMTLRYGISNCCPDEDDKWLIKKELIDLAALIDPDYICTPVQTCGCPPSSCGCGCSSTVKTCSSQ